MITIFVAYVFLAGAILAKKLVLQSVPPLLFVGLRMLPAGLIMLLMNIKAWKKHGWKRITDNLAILLLIALFTAFLPSLLKAYAIKNMPASKAVLLSCIGPFVTAFYTYMIWGEKISWQKIIGILIGMFGVILLLTSGSPIEETLKTWAFFSLPELAGLSAVLASRYGWIMIQLKVKKEVFTPLEINGIVMTIAGLIALLTATCTSQTSLGLGSNLKTSILGLTYAIIGGNIIGYTLYTEALKRSSATLVSLCGFSIPVLVTVGSYLFFDETITGNVLVSGSLVFIGIALFHTGAVHKTAVSKSSVKINN